MGHLAAEERVLPADLARRQRHPDLLAICEHNAKGEEKRLIFARLREQLLPALTARRPLDDRRRALVDLERDLALGAAEADGQHGALSTREKE